MEIAIYFVQYILVFELKLLHPDNLNCYFYSYYDS